MALPGKIRTPEGGPISRRRLINPGSTGQRTVLRNLGFVFAATGAIFMIVGLVDFFTAFGRGMPTRFWCFFVGMPLLALGVGMLKFGYMGAVTRYMAGEAAPVMKDTFNYMAGETREGVADVAEAVGRGLRGEAVGDPVACQKCGHVNDPVANFCDECGKPLVRSKSCASCGESNDADANFCDSCGQPLAAG